jgi:hypothetical protein
MDGGLENKWLMDFGCSRHKGYVTFGDDKKGKVLSTGIIRYNLLSISQLVDSDLDVLFRKFLILLASLFVAFLASKKSFKMMSYLLNLLSSI